MQYNSKIDIVQVSRSPDGSGSRHQVEGILYPNLPCRINWLRGAERILFDKVSYFRDGKVFCRAIDVTTKDRVVYIKKTYEIVNIANPDNMNRYMVIEIKLIE